jgi:hypothetical protein
MSELRKRFNACKKNFPDYGDVIVMWYAVNGMKYGLDTITVVFNDCVDKTEYLKSEKAEILAYLFHWSMSDDDPYKIGSI